MNKKTIERFYSKVTKNEGCWIWTGAKDWCGYGKIHVDGKLITTHRFVYELEKGNIPPGFHVLHSCDNPSCVNPDHLHLGTHKDNMRERSERKHVYSGGRGRKLTREQVLYIRSSGRAILELSRLYKVDPATVRAARDHKYGS